MDEEGNSQIKTTRRQKKIYKQLNNELRREAAKAKEGSAVE